MFRQMLLGPQGDGEQLSVTTGSMGLDSTGIGRQADDASPA